MKPRVLIFIDWFAPGYKAGGPTTSNVNIVDHLSGDFDFDIITSNTDYHATQPYEGIQYDCWTDRGNCKVWYCSECHRNFTDIKRAASLSGAPVWYINGIYSLSFSILPLVIAKFLKPKRLIVSPRGMLSHQTFTVKPVQKKLFLKVMKHSGLFSNVMFHGTNEDECNSIRTVLSSKSYCRSIPNLPKRGATSFSSPSKNKDEIRLVSFARISPEKNTLYAIKALEDCKTKVSFDLYGQINDVEYWNACETMSNRLPVNITIRYKGTATPNEIPSLYHDYDAMYLPTNGENFGHAILESFLCGRPVIISDRTPWRDLQAKGIGYDLSLDDPSAFASIIDYLSEEAPEKFNSRCERCFDFAQKVCNNPEVKQQYISLFSI